MKNIGITQNKFVIVDDTDFEELNRVNWYLTKEGYAARNDTHKKNVPRKTILMHKVINKTLEGFDTDHINGNKLDNRRENLRSITHQQNSMNRKINKNNKSGFKGVYWHKRTNKWAATIRTNNKAMHLGVYEEKEEAVEAYFYAAKIKHNEFARII